MNNKQYTPYDKFPVDEVRFTMGQDRTNKTTINMSVGAMSAQVCLVTPAAVTNWPRVTGDGNFGTMWGPTDIQKAKYSLDLTDGLIDGAHPVYFTEFSELLERVDDQLLHFVYENQLRILGRKNLSKDEVKMLQIRSVSLRPRAVELADRHSPVGHAAASTRRAPGLEQGQPRHASLRSDGVGRWAATCLRRGHQRP